VQRGGGGNKRKEYRRGNLDLEEKKERRSTQGYWPGFSISKGPCVFAIYKGRTEHMYFFREGK